MSDGKLPNAPQTHFKPSDGKRPFTTTLRTFPEKSRIIGEPDSYTPKPKAMETQGFGQFNIPELQAMISQGHPRADEIRAVIEAREEGVRRAQAAARAEAFGLTVE